MFFLWITGVCVISCFLWSLILYARWNRGVLECLNIPLESTHWLLGSNPNFHTDFHHRVELERNTRLGKVHGVYEGRTPVVFVNDAHLIQRISGVEGHFFEKRLNDLAANPVAAEALEFLTGEKWKFVRTLLSPQFTGAALKSHFPKIVLSMKEAINELKGQCQRKKDTGQALEIELHEWLSPLLLDMIFHIFFGVRVLGSQNHEFIDSMRAALFDGYKPDWTFNWMRVFPFILRLLPESIVSPEMSSFRTHILQLLELVQIKNEQVTKLNTNSTKGTDGLGKILLEMKNKVEQRNWDYIRLGISETTVLAQALQFLSASFVGVVSGVKELLWHLVNHSEIVDLILEEANQVLENNYTEELDFEAILKLNYLSATVLETIRLTPTFARQDRVLVEDWTLRNGVQILKGTSLAISLSSVHRNPDYWKDPDTFKPSRFLPQNKKHLVECGFLGFGVGSRQCPGKRLAILMISVIVLQLLRAFDIHKSKTGGREERPGLHMTIELKPLHLVFSLKQCEPSPN